MDIRQTIKPQSMADIEAQAIRVGDVMERARAATGRQGGVGGAPNMSVAQLANVCGWDKSKVAYRITKGIAAGLPVGTMVGNRREWSMLEAQEWARSLRATHMRPDGAAAVTLSIASVEGGSLKATTAVTLAQGLSMRGHQVLVVDVDPLGSLSSQLAVAPVVESDRCSLALLTGGMIDVGDAARPSRWPGIDLVGATPLLLSAELALAEKWAADGRIEVVRVLDRILDTARERYDIIIVDAPPGLGLLSTNALLSADGLIVPVSPALRELSALAHFWALLPDVYGRIELGSSPGKSLEFVDVVLGQGGRGEPASRIARQWAVEAWGDELLPVELPMLPSELNGAFASIYDLPRNGIDSKARGRAIDACERMCELIEQQIEAVWTSRIGQ